MGATNMPPSFMQPHGWVNTGTAGGSGIQKVVGALLLRQATSPRRPGKCLRIWELPGDRGQWGQEARTAPRSPTLGLNTGVRHALGCQEKKSPDQRPPERIRHALERGPSRWRPASGRRRDGVTGICPPARKGSALWLLLGKSRGVHGSHRPPPYDPLCNQWRLL